MSAAVFAAQHAEEPSAGGMGELPLGQVLPAMAIMTATAALLMALYLGREGGSLAHRLPIQRWGRRTIAGLPAWAVVPALLGFAGATVIQFAFFWDASLHLNKGREDGPFPNGGHWFILVGINLVLVAGWTSICMSSGRPSRASVRIREGWYAPAGGVALALTAPMFLVQVPADDIWHRVFGQDVTLWSPTHLVMLWANPSGLVAVIVLLAEAYAESARRAPRPDRAGLGRLQGDRAHRVIHGVLFGSLLVATTNFALEWELGVEQFRLSIHALAMGAAAALVLTAARLVGGRGSALLACAYFVAIRSLIQLFIVDYLEFAPTHFPLYLVEALVVEGAALAVGTCRIRRFALVSGAGIGTIGALAEWGWSYVFMPIEWPAHMIPAALALGSAGAMGGALIGAYLGGTAQRDPPSAAGGRTAVLAAIAGFAIVGASVAVLVQKDQPKGSGTVVLDEVEGTSGGREAIATVTLSPRDYVDGYDFFTTTAWQGGERARVITMERIGDGVFRTTEPVPLHGKWKSWMRLNRGSDLTALPIYLPADRSIPKAEVPAPARFTRSFGSDKHIMQRETKFDVGWQWLAASYAITLMFLSGWITILTSCLQRLARAYRAGAVRVHAD